MLASCCCLFGYKALTGIVFTENLKTITATKANYKDDINNLDFKPYDGNADPGITVSSIIACWKVCGTLHGNCKLHRRAGGVIIFQQNKNRCFLVCDRILLLPFRDCRCEQGEGQRRQAWLFLRIIVMLNTFRFVYSCVKHVNEQIHCCCFF